MSELKASVKLDMSGNLQQQARRASDALADMSRRGQQHMRMLSTAGAAVGRGLDRLGNRYTAFLTGGGLVMAGRQVMALETRFTRLGIQADKSAADMNALKREIYEVAQMSDVRVDPGEITGAIEAIVEKTGDLEFARQNIRNIGVAIQATGAQGTAIGELLGELQKMGSFKGPDDVLRALDTLNLQGKEGAFTLQNLAALGPRVITAYAGAVKGGRVGAQVLKEMGAALQVIRMGTGSSEQAATAFERLLSELQDKEKLKVLQANGIQLFDPKQPGAEVLRPINEILLEVLKKSGGRRTILGSVFGAESIRAFNALTPERIEQFMRAQGDGAATLRDAERAAKTSAAALQNLYTAWGRFADSELTGPIQSLADKLNSLEPGTVDRWMQIAKWIALIGGGAIIARKGLGAISAVRGVFGGKGAAGAPGGAAGMAGVTPVYVVNLPGAGLPGMAGGAAGGTARTAGRIASRAKSLAVLAGGLPLSAWGSMGAAGLATAGTGVLAAGGVGYAAGTGISKLIEGTAFSDAIGAGIAKALAAFGNESAREAVKLNGEVRIRLDQEGRLSSVSARSSNRDVPLSIDGGTTMVMP